jgi:hypothetical protein
MPFFFIGLVVLTIAIVILRRAIKDQDKEGIVGATTLIIAAVILMLFFGLFYTLVIP